MAYQAYQAYHICLRNGGLVHLGCETAVVKTLWDKVGNWRWTTAMHLSMNSTSMSQIYPLKPHTKQSLQWFCYRRNPSSFAKSHAFPAQRPPRWRYLASGWRVVAHDHHGSPSSATSLPSPLGMDGINHQMGGSYYVHHIKKKKTRSKNDE